MRPLTLDKIASVTRNCQLDREVRVGDDFECQEGDVIAVRILNSKSVYNQLELVSGRFSNLKPGDVIAGALGHRRALMGYAGRIPERLATGDQIQMLNMGGVLGECLSVSPEVGPPFECEVLGQVRAFPFLGSRESITANIARNAPSLDQKVNKGLPPVITLIGTCMNSGKTQACISIIQELTRRHLRVAAAKATGVSLRRDTLAMEDAGATATLCFTDFGVVTTQRSNAPGLTRTMLNHLARENADVIVLELGDGLMGDYGVDAILEADDLRQAMTHPVLAASDPVGAWGGVQMLRDRYGLAPTVLTGPCSDNAAGVETLERACELPVVNARSQPEVLTNHLVEGLN